MGRIESIEGINLPKQNCCTAESMRTLYQNEKEINYCAPDKMDLTSPEDLAKLGIKTVEQLRGMEITPEIFNNWKETAIKYNLDIRGELKGKNKNKYRDYYNHPISGIQEKIVNVADYGIIGEDYYYKRGIITEEKLIADLKNEELGKKYYKNNSYFRELVEEGMLNPECNLREGVAERLKELNRMFKKFGLQIKVKSGYRSFFTQTEAKKSFEDTNGKVSADNFIAKAGKSPHQTGGGLDVELTDLEGKQLKLKFKNRKEGSSPLYGENLSLQEQKGEIKLTEEQREIIQNRRILYHAMTLAGFTGHFREYWQFDFGDSLSAYILSQRISKEKGKKTIIPAIYGPITNLY